MGIDKDYPQFQRAVDAALSLLDNRTSHTIVVIPYIDRSWRIIYVKNKTALQSEEKLQWLRLWESVCRQGDIDKRESVLKNGIKRLLHAGNHIARLAQNDLDFHENDSKLAPGVKQGEVLFRPASSEHPFFRG